MFWLLLADVSSFDWTWDDDKAFLEACNVCLLASVLLCVLLILVVWSDLFEVETSCSLSWTLASSLFELVALVLAVLWFCVLCWSCEVCCVVAKLSNLASYVLLTVATDALTSEGFWYVCTPDTFWVELVTSF